MSPTYSCINNIFLGAIFVMIICSGAFNQSADEIMYNTTTKIELPFNGQCLGNGTFMFNVDFRLFEFKDLLLTNRDATTNNIDKCLSFLFCYESPSEYVKPQFKIANKNSNKFWNSCPENLLGFNISLCLKEDDKLNLHISFSFIEEKMRMFGLLQHSTMNFLRIHFEPNNVLIFYQIDDEDKEVEKLFLTKGDGDDKYDIYTYNEDRDLDRERQNFSFYNGNKMLLKKLSPWHVLLDLASISNGSFRIHHPKGCAAKINPNNQTILINCIPSIEKYVSCEFDKPNDEALISRGQNIIDATKWPWIVSLPRLKIEYNSTQMTEKGEEYLQIITYELLGVKIYVGHFDLSNPTVQISEEKPINVIIHENSTINSPSVNDIPYIDVALIKISEPLKFSENIRSICLANFELQNETIVRISGWGDKEEMDYEGSNSLFARIPEDNNILQESAAKILDNGVCLPLAIEAIKGRYRGISEEKFQEIANIEKELNKLKYCLQGLDNSTIQGGDSGSPMMFSINGTWFSFGIASGGFLRESLEEVPKPMYYAKIDGHLCDWIQIKTEGKVHCSGF